MALLIEIQPVANQSLILNVENSRYDITLRATDDIMTADVSRNEEVLLQGHRLVAGEPMIPYRYLERGNFTITTINDELPDYEKFGLTQLLYYVTIAELVNFRG